MMRLSGRLKFNGVDIGHHGTVTVNYTGNVLSVIIPRARGVKIWSTNDLGGGTLDIKVSAIYGGDTVIAGESYCANLYATLQAYSSGTLTITSEGSSISFTDCYIQSISTSSEKRNFTIDISILKSAS